MSIISSCLLKKLAAVTLPLVVFSVMSGPAAYAVEGTNPAKIFRPKGVKSKTQSATGVAIVNAASYLPGVCPGGIASIFGSNLSVISDVESATTDPLPFQIADITVFVNNIPAPLYTVAYSNGGDQINFQVPYETPVGLVVNGTGPRVDVYSNNVLVSSTFVDSYSEDPGIFIYAQNNIDFAIAVHASDFALVTPQDPAVPGEYIVLYTTGLGPLSINIVDGYGAPTNPLAYTNDPFTADVNSEGCSVLFSGLAPGFVGLYQLNLQLPSDLPPGNLPMQIFTQFSNSGIAYLPVN